MNIAITGSSSGIGRAVAERLAQEGVRIYGLSRSASPSSVHSIPCDVGHWPSVVSAAEQIKEPLNALICCAGLQGRIGLAMTLDPQDWEAVLQTNLTGAFFAIRALWPKLCQAPGRAKILCLSGGGAASPRPNFSPYAASKAGLVRLVENLAAEWQDLPVDINAIAPGAIATKMTAELISAGAAAAGSREFAHAEKTMAASSETLERTIGLIQFLLSPNSDGISGKLLSAPWDPWPDLPRYRETLAQGDIYNLRRILPTDRGQSWNP